MRNLKKLLAVIVAVCTVLAFTVPAFAADAAAAPADSKVCSDLGVLKGDTADGVSAAYLAKGTTRLQAAILQLRMLGKEAEAYAETSTDNFADADLVTWADGKALLAYLKKNPDLGWVGTEGKFDPAGACTAQMLYKVLLESVGFKTGTDFQYADTIKFAGTKGLAKLAAVANLTNNDVATGLVEALKANTADGKMTFAQKLVNANIIAESAAETAGLVPAAKALDVKSIAAKTNTRVDITLNTAASAKDLSKATITVKDAAAADLAVKSATLSSDGKSVVVVTAAQTAGTMYKMTIGATAYEFVGLVADTTKPTLDAAVAKTNTSVELTFSENLDTVTAAVATNYTVDGLAITAAAVDGKKVTLTTAAQTSGKLYEVVVANVTDLSGNVINSDNKSKKFGGKSADTTKPAIKTVVSEKGNTVKVTYTEAEMLGDSAITAANYTFDPSLTVSSAAFATGDTTKNALGNDVVVILKTSDQINGKLYKLTAKNIADKAGNVMDSTDKSFGGTALDTTKIGIATVLADTNTSVVVTLDDVVDAATVLPANFTMDDTNLKVTAAAVDGTAGESKVVKLTTSAQTSGKLYTLTIANLKDMAGNGVNTDADDKKFGGIAADTGKPTLTKAEATDKNTVVITFSEKVDSASATTLSNYVLDGSLGYPTSASLSDDKTVVTLKTLAQAAQVYSVKVSNVKDISGNVIEASSEKKFAGVGDALAKVKLTSAYAVDKATVKLVFNQTLNAGQAATAANYNIKTDKTGVTDAEASDSIALTAGLDADDIGGVATYDKDSKTVTITFPTDHHMNAGELYTVVVTGVTGEYGAALDTDNDEQVFAGLDSAKADLKIDAVNVLDSKTVELIFNAPIRDNNTIDETKIELFKNEGDIGGAADSIGVAAADDKVSGSKLTVNLGTALANNTVYYVNLLAAAGVTDISGLYAAKVDDTADKSEGIFATGTLGTVTLKVDAAVMTNVNTLEIYFNKNVATTGFNPNTDIAIKDGATDVVPVGDFKTVFKAADNKVTVFFVDSADPKLTAGSVYDVVFTGANVAHIQYANDTTITLSATAADQKTQVAAVSSDNAVPYMVSASAVADDKAKVTLSEAVSAAGGLTAADIKIKNNKTGIELDSATDYTVTWTAGSDNFLITLANGGKFIAGTTYEIAVVNGSDIKDFAGIADIKKATATAGNYDNSVTFTGNGSVTALTLVDAQITLTYGNAAAADQVTFSTTAGLAAATKYIIGFTADGTNGREVSSVVVTTAGDKSLAATAIGASVLGLAAQKDKVSVYDVAGNLLATSGSITAG